MINEYIRVKKSGIHNNGVYAKKHISKGTRIIEYVGERISKKESERRADLILDASKKNSANGAVYIFEINDDFDLDGNVDFNTARFINHSCSPNCESEMDGERIWILATRDIKKGEELLYNYGYDVDNFEEHPCICGSDNCLGFIASEDKWVKLKSSFKKKFKNKKVLVVFYSRSGVTKKVGCFLSEYFGFDVDEIIFPKRKGAFNFLKCAFEALSKKKPNISFKHDPKHYDLILVGSPVWAGTVSSPIRSYLDFCYDKKVVLFCTSGDGKTINLKDLNISFKKHIFLKSTDVKTNKFANKLVNFVRSL